MKRLKFITLLSSLAILVLLTIQVVAISANSRYTQDIEFINQKTNKINKANSILNHLLDIETGGRGFLLTGDKEFLSPYENAQKKLSGELGDFYKYLSTDQIAKLSALVALRIQRTNLMIEKKQNNHTIYSADLAVGKKVMDEIRDFLGDIVEADKASIQSHVSQVSNGLVTSGLIGGSIVSLSITALCIYFVIISLRNKMKIEKDLRLSLATSEAISREIDFGLIASDSSGNVMFANKWVTSRIPSLKTVPEFFVSNEIAMYPVNQLLRGDIDKITELELNLKNQKRIFTINSSPFQIEEQNKGTILSIIDTTDSTNRMANLVSGKQMADVASRAKSDFLAKMSHEIRTPLNAILGVGEILSLSRLDIEQQRCLEIFKRSAVTLNNLVNDILDLSKIEAGKIDLIMTPFSLKNLISSCTSIMDFRASQKGLLFISETDSDEDHFIGDEGRLRQIALNLLSNAIKFTEEGEVHFSIVSKGKGNKREISFKVKDTGKGIAPDKINGLFADYHQENSSISADYGGTGLGLSLSRELARLMGGDIVATSHLGKGSEFIFTVTLDVAAGSFVEENIDEGLQFDEVSILLVDDNPENRFIVKKYLNDLNIQITEAVDGEDAIEQFNENKFDLILMDINMPKKNGIVATKEIRDIEQEKNLQRTVIVALSANALSVEYNNAMNAGCEDYLTKPISRKKLISMIYKWLGDKVQEDDSEEEIDLDIQKLIPAYLASRKKDITAIKEAIEGDDMAIVKRIAHNIKGTAKSYGQVELDQFARNMEDAISANNKDEMLKLIDKIEKLLG